MEDLEKKYPVNEYAKKTFTFTPGELRELGPLDSITKMGQLAQVMISNMVAGTPLKRVGIRNSPDVGLLYDINKGEFYVYEPKFWCSICNNKKAEFSYNNKAYCPKCFEILKTQAIKTKSLKDVKPTVKKKA